MTPQQIDTMKLALVALKWSKPHEDAVISHSEAITTLEEVLADHAMRETQRLGQEIEQEPVAITNEMAFAFHSALTDGAIGEGEVEEIKAGLAAAFAHITTPPQRKPLTNEEIWSAIRPLTKSDENCKTLVDVSMDEYRAIEAAHGIKENT